MARLRCASGAPEVHVLGVGGAVAIPTWGVRNSDRQDADLKKVIADELVKLQALCVAVRSALRKGSAELFDALGFSHEARGAHKGLPLKSLGRGTIELAPVEACF
eukprot:8905360-Alexandrium_andersonii.AAC.1